MNSSGRDRLQSASGSFAENKRSKMDEQGSNPQELFQRNFKLFKTSVLEPIVAEANEMLQSSGSVLDIVSNPSNTFFSAQIVLHDSKKDINLLTDPYIIIEGFPRAGEVRIAEGNSANPGEKISIVDAEVNTEQNQNILINNLSQLLESQT